MRILGCFGVEWYSSWTKERIEFYLGTIFLKKPPLFCVLKDDEPQRTSSYSTSLSLHFHTEWRRPYIFFLRILKNPWVAPLYAQLYKIWGPLSLHETFFTNAHDYCCNGLNKITSLVVSILCHSSIRVLNGHWLEQNEYVLGNQTRAQHPEPCLLFIIS